MKLDFLHTAYALSPPYVSLYLETARDTEHAAKAVDLRWRQARETLEAAGADAATLDAVAEVVTDPGRAAPGRAVFAAGGRVGYTESLPVPPRPIAEWSPLPRALPLLFLRDEPIAHLRVLVDRQGADISVCGSRRHAMTVRGRDWPIQKVREGGWSEPRYQRSAVETWEANAKEVADVVARQADAIDAKLIIVAGDVRAREMLLDHLPPARRERTVLAEHGGRAAGIDEDKWEVEVAGLLSSYQNTRRRGRVTSFREGHGRGDAVAGVREVVSALRAGQADVVLLNDPLEHGPPGTLWFGPAPTALGETEAEARDLGIADPTPEQAGAVLVRAMVGTDVTVETVDRGELDLTDGIGASLRFAI
jgi:hypothetical protein